MEGRMSRRRALATGIAGLGAGAGCTERIIPTRRKSADGETRYADRTWWEPGGNPDYIRNLSAGKTTVRLACMSGETMLDYPGEGGDIAGMVARVRSAGYTAANAHTSQGRRNGWLDAPESDIVELKRVLAEYDVDFYDIMVWTNLIHPDVAVREKNIRYVVEAFEAAERCGVRSITGITGSMAPGDYGMYTRMHPDNFTREAWKRSVESIRRILGDTAGFSVVWGMEQCITTAVNSPEATRQIIEDVADPRCKCVLDVTNMICLQTYYRSAELIDQVFDLVGEDIVGCHAKDFLLNDRMLVDMVELPPGKGILDYELLLARMSRLSWPRTLMLEHFAPEAYPPAKHYIEETARRVGIEIYA